jgi:hypothetical protein
MSKNNKKPTSAVKTEVSTKETSAVKVDDNHNDSKESSSDLLAKVNQLTQIILKNVKLCEDIALVSAETASKVDMMLLNNLETAKNNNAKATAGDSNAPKRQQSIIDIFKHLWNSDKESLKAELKLTDADIEKVRNDNKVAIESKKSEDAKDTALRNAVYKVVSGDKVKKALLVGLKESYNSDAIKQSKLDNEALPDTVEAKKKPATTKATTTKAVSAVATVATAKAMTTKATTKPVEEHKKSPPPTANASSKTTSSKTPNKNTTDENDEVDQMVYGGDENEEEYDDNEGDEDEEEDAKEEEDDDADD